MILAVWQRVLGEWILLPRGGREESMRLKDDQKGFSLVEMIIVIAIIAIVASAALGLQGYVKLANSEKAAKTLEGALGKQQARAMSKAEKSYLYIYELDGTYYMCISSEDRSQRDTAVMSAGSGTAIGRGMEIYSVAEDGSRTKIEGETIIKISYKRDGTFDGITGEYQSILLQGSFPKEIKLIKDTGRYIVKDVE